MSVCKCFQVVRPKDSVKVLLLKHKAEGGYSFVNLTKGHICPCRFHTEEDAIQDLESYKKRGDIIEYKEVEL